MTEQGDDQSTIQALAMILLGPGQNLDVEAFAAAWREQWPGADALDVPPRSESDSTWVGAFGQGSFGLSMMPVPIPEPDLPKIAAASWMWPEAAAAVAEHTAHAIVFVNSPGTEAAVHRDCTRLVAAALSATNGLGVYVGDAGMLVRADAYQALSHSFDPAPAHPLWISFQGLRGRDGTNNLLTVGLTGFGCLELEITGSNRPIEELREIATDIAGYLAEHGQVIRDGDTVGGSTSQHISVRYSDSIVGRPGTVMRLVGY
jgi:hypothetical protein